MGLERLWVTGGVNIAGAMPVVWADDAKKTGP